MQAIKIISGGQTGADRAALDWAIARGIPCGGWCPKGRNAEDGPLDQRYPLIETPTFRYIQRTEWNARDSDATVLFTIAPELTEGSLATAFKAAKHNRPWLHLSQEILNGDASRAADFLQGFITRHEIAILNVAGPRGSKEPNVGRWVQAVLEATFLVASDGANDSVVSPDTV